MRASLNDARTVTLRRVGGSLMMTLPRAAVDSLDLREGSRMAYEIRDGLLVLDPGAPADPAESEWLDVPDVGGETIP